MIDEPKRPDIVVPEESFARGPFLRGELRKAQFSFSDILAQFERITPHTRKTRIYLLLTAEQAKKLYVIPGPFTFEGSFCTRDSVVETRLAKDIWLKPITQITHQEAFYWTQTSGTVGSLEIRTQFMRGSELDSRKDSNSAWFVARPCFALGILANQSKEEAEESVKYGFSRQDIHFSLTDSAKASILRYPYLPFYGALRNDKLRGYSITVEGVKDPLVAKRDADVLILLASFASRQRSVIPHWSYYTKEELFQFWQFNYGKCPKRYERGEPVAERQG